LKTEYDFLNEGEGKVGGRGEDEGILKM